MSRVWKRIFLTGRAISVSRLSGSYHDNVFFNIFGLYCIPNLSFIRIENRIPSFVQTNYVHSLQAITRTTSSPNICQIFTAALCYPHLIYFYNKAVSLSFNLEALTWRTSRQSCPPGPLPTFDQPRKPFLESSTLEDKDMDITQPSSQCYLWPGLCSSADKPTKSQCHSTRRPSGNGYSTARL